MKNRRLRVLALTALCCATSLQIMAETIKVKVINDIGITTPVTVSFTQNGHLSEKKIYRSAQFECLADETDVNKDYIFILTRTKINNRLHEKTLTSSGTALKNKELHITTEVTQQGKTLEISIIPVAKKVAAPKKQKIRAYKPDKDDQKEDWIVEILDNKGVKIATSTFKENTDYRAKNLYLQLNQPPVADNDENAQYNDNTIKVFSKNLLLPELKINAASFKAGRFIPGSNIKITKNSIDIVDNNKNSVLTDEAKAESQEVIEVEEVLP